MEDVQGLGVPAWAEGQAKAFRARAFVSDREGMENDLP